MCGFLAGAAGGCQPRAALVVQVGEPLRHRAEIARRAVGAVLCIAPLALADQSRSDEAAKAPDNTGRNRQIDKPTADQQKNNKSDLEITRQIRRAIVKDKSLSISAHNVKIITTDGAVTLRGPVKDADEKARVVAKAREVAGQARVDDQLEVEAK